MPEIWTIRFAESYVFGVGTYAITDDGENVTVVHERSDERVVVPSTAFWHIIGKLRGDVAGPPAGSAP